MPGGDRARSANHIILPTSIAATGTHTYVSIQYRALASATRTCSYLHHVYRLVSKYHTIMNADEQNSATAVLCNQTGDRNRLRLSNSHSKFFDSYSMGI